MINYTEVLLEDRFADRPPGNGAAKSVFNNTGKSDFRIVKGSKGYEYTVGIF